MPKKNTSITFKLPYDRLAALHLMYDWLISDFKTENDHEELLLEHAIEYRALIAKKLESTQLTYKIEFTSVQALAFYHIWNRVDTSHNQYGNVTICEMIKLIDKTSINAKILNNGKRS